ncbi:nucleotidyltransferase family protein [uncultured Rhodospira sp.]|uniref:nucleotidyltransferase family protein n=1 Tax=uncultured Rhodospira sp. TaxID=1936189 RepID=UPI002622ECD0|nr:nucleotidyltransferase family protein [uncultured Rhodospira sp.]
MTRAEAGAAPRLGLVLLAAGQGRRMGGANKLLRDLDGAPLVRVAGASLAAALPDAARVVVTGRDGDAVAAALDGLGFARVHNPRFEEGMGGSLAAGVAALPDPVEGLLVALGDMPGPWEAVVPAVVAAFAADPSPATAIVRPTHADQDGHPVLWGAAHRPALAALSGDVGGRDLLRRHIDRLRRVAVDDGACVHDIDRPQDLDAARARLADGAERKGWYAGGPSS